MNNYKLDGSRSFVGLCMAIAMAVPVVIVVVWAEGISLEISTDAGVAI